MGFLGGDSFQLSPQNSSHKIVWINVEMGIPSPVMSFIMAICKLALQYAILTLGAVKVKARVELGSNPEMGIGKAKIIVVLAVDGFLAVPSSSRHFKSPTRKIIKRPAVVLLKRMRSLDSIAG